MDLASYHPFGAKNFAVVSRKLAQYKTQALNFMLIVKIACYFCHVDLSVHMEQLGSQWKKFHDI